MYPLVLPSLLTCPPPVSCLISSPCLGFDLGEFQFNTVTMHIDTQMFEVLYIGNNQQNQDLMQSFFFFLRRITTFNRFSNGSLLLHSKDRIIAIKEKKKKFFFFPLA